MELNWQRRRALLRKAQTVLWKSHEGNAVPLSTANESSQIKKTLVNSPFVENSFEFQGQGFQIVIFFKFRPISRFDEIPTSQFRNSKQISVVKNLRERNPREKATEKGSKNLKSKNPPNSTIARGIENFKSRGNSRIRNLSLNKAKKNKEIE